MHKNIDWNSVCFVIILISIVPNDAKGISQAEVSYYERLIENQTREAFIYNLPNDASEYEPRVTGTEQYGTYDYIIIGASPAGSVIASRLSENPKWRILLLEAGGCETNFTDIPTEHLYLQGLRFNWNYLTTPQTTCCLGMVDRRCAQTKGKVLGGTSTINGLVYSRANKEDYDRWEQQGNPGWSYRDVLPYFIKSENSNIDGDPGYHGKGGYWNVEYHRPNSPIANAIITANNEIGIPETDYNGRNQLGIAHAQLNNLHGKRDSLAKAFLTPARNRKNLKILIDSYVLRVLVNNDTKTAEGVIFTRNGQTYIAHATKEVIVSAGTFASPTILMHSGIGPAEDLTNLRIPVVQNLPVGKTLIDHPNFFAAYFSLNYTEPEISLEKEVVQYLKGVGHLTIALNSQVVGFYKTDDNDGSERPDVELEYIPPNSTQPYMYRSLRITEESYYSLFDRIDGRMSFGSYVVALHPKSVGNLSLASNNPYEYPLINVNYLSDPENYDVEKLYQGVQILTKISQAPALQKYNATLIPPDIPACRSHKPLSREYWYCTFRHLAGDLYHPVATCRMGPDPKNSIVDHTLKVHGIKKLRVADASVIPLTISGHTSAPSVMIGEKLSDMIKKESGV